MDEVSDTLHEATKNQLRSIIERYERLDEEKAAIASDQKDILAEAKSNGFDVKALRTIIRLRKKDDNERLSEETILATYMHALGMIQESLPFRAEEMQKTSHLARVHHAREREDA